MSKWRPIESAPKDGTKFLALCQPRHIETGTPMSFHYINVVWWRDKSKNILGWRHTLNDSHAEPTHWMPLPEPPK